MGVPLISGPNNIGDTNISEPTIISGPLNIGKSHY